MDDEGMVPEETSADEVGMMADDGMVDLNEEMQSMPGDIPEDDPGMVVDEPEPMEDPLLNELQLDVPQGVTLVPAPEGLIDPGMLEAHPLTNTMPVKSEHEYEALKESIRINGLQQPLTRFEGKILDGRHRLRACMDLGIPVAVMDFVGSTDDALVYVLQANQYHHDYSIGQRAAVAALLEPEVAEMVAQGRLEKVRAAWEAKRDGSCPQSISDNPNEASEPTESRIIAGRMMRVNRVYVSNALRIQREAPELFEQLHAGTITMQAAMKTLTGEIDDARRQQVKAARSEFSRAANDPIRYPDFLEQFRAFMAQFPR